MISLSCILDNIQWIATRESFSLSEYRTAVFEEASIIISEREKNRTRRKFSENLERKSFHAIPFPEKLASSLALARGADSRSFGHDILKDILKWQFFPPEIQKTIPRQRNFKDYVQLGLLSSEEVHEVLEALFPVTSQCQPLSYLILKSRLADDPSYNFPPNYLDTDLLQLIDDYYLTGGYVSRVFTRTCALCGKLYVDTYHPTRATTTFGYDPYCQECSGDGGSEWFNLEAKSADRSSGIDDLLLLKNYSDAIQTVPTKETMRSILAPPCEVKTVFDAWVRLPSYRFYTQKYDDFRIPLIKIGVLPEQVLSGKYGYFCIAKDGHKCRSLAELKIDNLLFDNNIAHEVEPLYPFHAKYNKSRRRRADWKIGDTYVEYWGLPNQEQYSKKMQEKSRICEDQGISLIELTQYDLFDLSSVLRKIKAGAMLN